MIDKALKPNTVSLSEPSKTDTNIHTRNSTFYCTKCDSRAFRSTEPCCFQGSNG
jgi:hypothetical protein